VSFISIKDGGVASGFNHVEINDFSSIKRLMWVRGRRQVRADVVPMKWESINKSDCFIVDNGEVGLSYVYVVTLINKSKVRKYINQQTQIIHLNLS